MLSKTATGQIARGIVITLLSLLGVLGSLSSVNAATIFFDNFEDGDSNGWTETVAGSGTTGVVDNNGSLRAYSNQLGSQLTSLSHDFEYVSSHTLQFDMQVIANAVYSGGSTIYSAGGVNIIFLTQFNVPLGTLTFIHDSDENVPDGQLLIDETLNNYSGTMLEYAELVGLNDSSGIAKITLEFFARASRSSSTGRLSESTVWFDNVTISDELDNSSVDLVTSDLWIGAVINTEEKDRKSVV